MVSCIVIHLFQWYDFNPRIYVALLLQNPGYFTVHTWHNPKLIIVNGKVTLNVLFQPCFRFERKLYLDTYVLAILLENKIRSVSAVTKTVGTVQFFLGLHIGERNRFFVVNINSGIENGNIVCDLLNADFRLVRGNMYQNLCFMG